MPDSWYYAQGNVQHGPVDEDEIRRLIAADKLRATDLVWRPGMSNWTAVRDVRAALFQQPATASVTAASADAHEPAADLAAIRPARRTVRSQPEAAVFINVVMGGIVCLLAFAIGCLFFFGPPSISFFSTPMEGTFSWRLNRNQEWYYEIYVPKHHRVELQLISNGKSDVDLYVYDGDTLLCKDESFSSNASLTFLTHHAGTYRIKLWNRMIMPDVEGRNGHNSGELRFWLTDESSRYRE